ncbi:EamA family transporter [Streptomyces sp. NPDC007861]|uniref:EamA family transporter n=1 Tax=Streptomyces sp. NPDC007861 TaxID=3154893 RepID=UPI00340335B6
MPEVLALSAAVLFGLVHFFSGLLSRRADSYGVAMSGQLGGMVLLLPVALVAPVLHLDTPILAASHTTAGAMAWGALSGVGTGMGVAYLYRGFAAGQMSVVAPLSDLAAVALPVLVSVAVFGDRPDASAWLGIALALPALWMISYGGRPTVSGTAHGGARFGLLAGIGFAVQFLAISRIDPAAGLWPIIVARLTATLTIVPMARAAGATLLIPRNPALPALCLGSMGAVALLLYLAATLGQLVSLATVLAALYPAITVMLAVVHLHERPTRVQTTGLACAAVAVALIALG